MFHTSNPYTREVYHVADMDKVAPNKLFAKIDNKLLFEKKYNYGDVIKCKYENIIDSIKIKEPKIEERFQLMEDQQSKAQPQVPASNFLPNPQISNMFAQNVDPTTGLTSTQTALLSPEEQVIAKRLRT